MSEMVEMWDRGYFDEQGHATLWLRSWNKGESWREVDCSIFPDKKPPFVKVSSGNAAWIEQHGWAGEQR
jgi:hypothetical protein